MSWGLDGGSVVFLTLVMALPYSNLAIFLLKIRFDDLTRVTAVHGNGGVGGQA